MLWLYLRLPRLQLDTQAPDDDCPVAVVDERDNRVVQLNEPASRAGITLGMGLATAAALCREVQLLPYQQAIETRRLEELAHGLYDISGDISTDPPCGMWLGASRMVKYHNGFDNYCKKITRFLSRRRLSARLASGHTPLAAKLLAHSPEAPLIECPDRLRQAIRDCPLSATQLPEQTQEHLHRLGIKHLSGLLDIPPKALSRRFDRPLAEYVSRLVGYLPHPLPFYQPPDYFRQHRELPCELTSSHSLTPWIRRLLEELEAFLHHRDRVVERIELTLQLRNREPLSLTIGAAQGESRAERWCPLVQLTLERHPLEAPVGGLTLTARTLMPRPGTSGDLLGERHGASMEPAQLVALLQARLGSDRVRGLMVEEDFRPLRASIESPPLEPSSPTARGTEAAQPVPPALRPAFLLAEPQAYLQPLEIIEGPERITTGWWDGEPQVRDYYIVRNAQGQWCWAFREPNRSGWFLQGYFA
ncbi:DNA polymerase Y family protein [Marinimicrobium sp. C6131]|uniref:Y-family DNA polymerase n=1 Tax=Marinimicrobium sp. C6131 TaxID=3022676 RepID=UPI00223DBB15|nr:DNA polymerase Y family protein [Marinimicrobium sp. C6131]UZJ45457.1 DNA polymerase Y family protein [Marinimicrobium sp. C6131]